MDRVYIVDWDDTALFTSVITEISKKNNVSLYDVKLPLELAVASKYLEEIVINFFNKLSSTGKVYIVTNAELQWFEYTWKLFFPNLSLENIKVFSAIDIFKKDFPTIKIVNGYPENTDGSQWKYNTIKKLLTYYEPQWKQMVSIGDSLYEKHASLNIQQQFPEKNVVTIKMIEYPSINELIYELKNITTNLEILIKYNHSQLSF